MADMPKVAIAGVDLLLGLVYRNLALLGIVNSRLNLLWSGVRAIEQEVMILSPDLAVTGHGFSVQV